MTPHCSTNMDALCCTQLPVLDQAVDTTWLKCCRMVEKCN